MEKSSTSPEATAAAPLPPGAWLIVGLLWLVACMNFLARLMLPTMHGSIMGSFPMTEAQFGLLSSVFLWVYGCLSPFAGFLADRFSRTRVIIISLIAWSTVNCFTAYATSFREILVMRVLLGVTEAAYLPAAVALIADYHRGGTRAFATGLHMSGAYCGYMLSGLGGWLAEIRSWHYAFTVIGMVGILYGGFLILFLREAPGGRDPGTSAAMKKDQARFGEAVVVLLSRGSYLAALAYWGLLGVGCWAVAGWVPTYLHEHFNLSQGMAGFYSGGFVSAAGLIGLLAGGAWADRWSRLRPRRYMFVPALTLCAVLPGILGLTLASKFMPLPVLGLIVFGLATGPCDSTLMPIVCLITDARYRATAYGMLNMMATVSAGLGVFLTGALRDMGFGLGQILIGGGVCVAVCPLLIMTMRPQSSGKIALEPALAGGSAP